jgi:molybdopterin/thiamine biosynthesis adenylyltransferase
MVRILDGDTREDRFSRLRLIPWWDQSKISSCQLLVVGAGALGNEILKNAALLGFRKVVVVDLDRIEESNLSRTILYRQQDIGKFKAEAAAKAYRSLAPDALVQPLVADIVNGCGLGLFDWADVVIARPRQPRGQTMDQPLSVEAQSPLDRRGNRGN